MKLETFYKAQKIVVKIEEEQEYLYEARSNKCSKKLIQAIQDRLDQLKQRLAAL